MFKPHNPPPDAQTNHSGRRPDVAAGGAAPRRSGRLLGLLRKLIHYGNDLLATVRQHPPPDQLYDIGQNFGTRDIQEVIARIVRGLWIAAELEDRILHCAARIDRPCASGPPSTPTPASGPCAASSAESRRARQLGLTQPVALPAARPREEFPSLLDHWPTPGEIAARIRGRPVDIVLAEICHDVGIGYHHPQWWELLDAIDRDGGKYARFMRAVPIRKPIRNLIPVDRSLPPPDRPGR